jgi:tetrachlorobenzoquinone reductase
MRRTVPWCTAAVGDQDGRIGLRVERFASSGDAEAIRAGDRAFELELNRSGEVLTVHADRTALDVVHDYIPGHPYSCLEGECGSCEVAVLRGEVDHRDQVLSEQERRDNSAMMLCVSRALSDRLVIDL